MRALIRQAKRTERAPAADAAHVPDDAAWRAWPDGARFSRGACALPGADGVYVCAEWLPRAVEAALLAHLPAVPKTALRGREVAMLGGTVTPAGLQREAFPPCWLAGVVERLTADGVFDVAHTPNHALVNVYRRGGGIMPHTDGPAYHPVVAVVSLDSPVVFEFEGQVACKLLAAPRSLLVFEGAAYHDSLHGVQSVTEDSLEGVVMPVGVDERLLGALAADGVLVRGDRSSLTIRHVPLCP